MLPFTDDMMQYIASPKDSTKKLLLLINELGKIIGYSTSIEKSVQFLYIKDKLSEREMKIIIYNCIKMNKYLGINLTKEKDLHTEKYKTQMKEIKEDTNKLKDISCSKIGRKEVVKVAILLQEGGPLPGPEAGPLSNTRK